MFCFVPTTHLFANVIRYKRILFSEPTPIITLSLVLLKFQMFILWLLGWRLFSVLVEDMFLMKRV
jgi:hypothetical protein